MTPNQWRGWRGVRLLPYHQSADKGMFPGTEDKGEQHDVFSLVLAPLHNAANLMGVELFQKLLSSGDHQMSPQVGIFDTVLPWSVIQQKKLRKYGFHGSSYRYVANKAAQRMERPLQQLRLMFLHLGSSGCSVCAIQEGRSVDTSMGFTPLKGLAMATRSGDAYPMVLPPLLEHITEEEGKKKEKEGGERAKGKEEEGHTVGTEEAKPWDKLEELLNKRSGLVGLCGHDDTRDAVRLMEEGTPEERKRATLAYYVALGGLDALIFTGGIGENSAPVREAICEGLRCLDGSSQKLQQQQRREGGAWSSCKARQRRLHAPKVLSL